MRSLKSAGTNFRNSTVFSNGHGNHPKSVGTDVQGVPYVNTATLAT